PDLEKIEKVGSTLERLIAPIRGTRSVLYERNLGGLYLDIVPDRKKLARYGLRVGDVERVIEAAIGGAPISTTVEGRNRFSVNVRYPQDLRNDLESLRRVLVPVPRSMSPAGPPDASMGMGKQGALLPTTPVDAPVLYAQNMTPSKPGMATDAPAMGMPRASATMTKMPPMNRMGGTRTVGTAIGGPT